MICERCYGQIHSSGYISGRQARSLADRLATYSVAVQVPGAYGSWAYFHSPCYGLALREFSERGRT